MSATPLTDAKCPYCVNGLVTIDSGRSVNCGHLEKANVELACEAALLRGVLSELVAAVEGASDMDEADGHEFNEAMDRLDTALEKAKPLTETALIKE